MTRDQYSCSNNTHAQNSSVCVYMLCSVDIRMASDDVTKLADSLAKTQVDEGELSYKGQGRKLDNAQSGERTHTHLYTHIQYGSNV